MIRVAKPATETPVLDEVRRQLHEAAKAVERAQYALSELDRDAPPKG